MGTGCKKNVVTVGGGGGGTGWEFGDLSLVKLRWYGRMVRAKLTKCYLIWSK